MLPDTSGIEDKDFEVLPAGWYDVVLHYTDEQTSKSGKEFLNIQFRTDNNRVIFDKCFYQENCLWKLKSLKKAIGMPDTETEIKDYWGTRMKVKIKVREYEGEEQNDVERYKAMEGTPVAMNPETKPKFDPNNGEKMPWDEDK